MFRSKLPNRQENRMKRIHWTTLLSLTTLVALFINSAFAMQNGSIVASAVIVPVQISKLAFLTPALIKEVAVKEGDNITAGQTLVVLNTPEAGYNVVAAEAALRSALGEEKVQSYRRVKDRRKGKVYFDVVPPEIRQVAHARVEQAQAALET